MQKAYLFLVLFLLARVSLGQTVSFSYDASGNRTSRSASSGPIYSLSVSGQTGLSNVISNGGSGSFVVNSTNVNWSISNLPSWASVSKSSGGNGSTTVTVTVAGNSSTTARTQALSITGANASAQSLTISQVGASGGGGCPVDEVAIGTSGTNIVCIKHWNNNYVLCEKYVVGSTTHYIPRGKNYWGGLSRYANVDQYYSCIDESTTGWGGLACPLATNYTIAGWTRGTFTDGAVYYIQNSGTCTSSAPNLSSSSGNGYADLTANGCSGTVTWNTGSTGATLRVNNTGTYSATCTQSGCTPSAQSSISVTVTGGGSGSSTGCIVNKVRLFFRGDCCAERLYGAKIQGSTDGNTWSDIYTINQNAINGAWAEYVFSNTVSYNYVRFQAGPNGYGELHQLEFYNGSTRLVGTALGSSGVANNDPGYAAVNILNGFGFWHGSSPGSENYAGLHLTGCAISGGGTTTTTNGCGSSAQNYCADGTITSNHFRFRTNNSVSTYKATIAGPKLSLDMGVVPFYGNAGWLQGYTGCSGCEIYPYTTDNINLPLGSYRIDVSFTGTNTIKIYVNGTEKWTSVRSDCQNGCQIYPEIFSSVQHGDRVYLSITSGVAARMSKEELIQLEPESSILKISPNPTNGAIKAVVNLSEEAPFRLSIVDMQGNTLRSYDIAGKAGNNELPLDLHQERAGVYFVRLQLKNNQLVSKVIKID